jgi:carboxyl-terminal processing protease
MKDRIFSCNVAKWYLVSCLFLCACAKSNDTIVSPAPKSFSEVFEQFWSGMSQNYVYWDIDTTNWDFVKKKYKIIFDSLKLEKPDEVRKSVTLFRDMTKDLIDSHFFIKFTNNSIRDSSLFPALDRKKRLLSRQAYSFYKLDTPYLDRDYKLDFDTYYRYNFQPMAVLSGTIGQNILYFSTTQCNLSASYYSQNTQGVKGALNYFFGKLTRLNSDFKGLILDFRGNPGGDIADLNFLLGRLIDQPLHFGFVQYKNGSNRLDFTPWIKSEVKPGAQPLKVIKPIVILIDNFSASLAETIAIAMSTLPNVTVLGENTFGATGPVFERDVFNAGEFKINGFLEVQASSCKFKSLDGSFYEGIGFTPDRLVPFDQNAVNNRRDLQLELAIQVLR